MPEAVVGQNILSEAFLAGSGSPAVVIANASSAAEVATVATTVTGVTSATVGETNGDITQINVVLDAAAEIPESFAAVEQLRSSLAAIDGANALIGGLDAQSLDVDYNFFLVTRAREEAVKYGTRQGMVRALSSTGGVITSAGILLAAVFAVLGVLPLITLTQIDIIV